MDTKELPAARRRAIVFGEVAAYDHELDAVAEVRTAIESARFDVIYPAIEAHSGQLARWIVDSVPIEFPSAQCAVLFAYAAQEQLGQTPLRWRFGIDYGEVSGVGEETAGEALRIASGLTDFARPGEIVVTSTVFDRMPRGGGIQFDALGINQSVRITESIHLYEVRLELPDGYFIS